MSLSLCLVNYQKPAKGEEKFKLPKWAKAPSIGVALHVVDDGSVVETLPLDNVFRYYMFGRYPTCPCEAGKPIRLKHLTLSRQHAVIVHAEAEAVYIIDLDSAHGTFVGSERLQPYSPKLLNNGNTITFGDWERKFLVRTFPIGDRLFDPSDISLSRKLLAGMTVTCDEEDLETEDAETRLHTKLNSVVSYPSPKGKNKKKRHSFCFPSGSQTNAGFANTGSIIAKYRKGDAGTGTDDNGSSSFAEVGKLNKIAEDSTLPSEMSNRTRSSSLFWSHKRPAPSQDPGSMGGRRNSTMARRRVSFSVKCHEFIPEHSHEIRKRNKENEEGLRHEARNRGDSNSSSSDGEMETVDVNVFDPKKDLPEDSGDLRQELPPFQNENISSRESQSVPPRKANLSPKTPKVGDSSSSNIEWDTLISDNVTKENEIDGKGKSFSPAPGIFLGKARDSNINSKGKCRIRQRRRSNSLNGARFSKYLGSNGLLTQRKSFISPNSKSMGREDQVASTIGSEFVTSRIGRTPKNGITISENNSIWGVDASKSVEEPINARAETSVQRDDVQIVHQNQNRSLSHTVLNSTSISDTHSLKEPLPIVTTKRQKV